MPIGHVSLPTTPTTYKPMREFYLATLAPLGYTLFMEQDETFLGLQANRDPDFWLHCGGKSDPSGLPELVDPALNAEENRKRLPRGKVHVAFSVGSRALVGKWFQNAVKAGGIPNGEPGERLEYSKGYYAAFVLDPTGNNIEVVYFNPWWMQLIKAAPKVATVAFGAVAGHFALGYATAAGWV